MDPTADPITDPTNDPTTHPSLYPTDAPTMDGADEGEAVIDTNNDSEEAESGSTIKGADAGFINSLNTFTWIIVIGAMSCCAFGLFMVICYIYSRRDINKRQSTLDMEQLAQVQMEMGGIQKIPSSPLSGEYVASDDKHKASLEAGQELQDFDLPNSFSSDNAVAPGFNELFESGPNGELMAPIPIPNIREMDNSQGLNSVNHGDGDVCHQCGFRREGKVHDDDKLFYCFVCWDSWNGKTQGAD